VSYLIASLFRLPDPYWAAISTLVVMQSTLGAALPISAQRFAGTAIGAAVGAAGDTWFDGGLWAFGIAVLLVGLFCAALRVERGAYRYAGITLAIVMLVPRSVSPWLIATHRFIEVSVGIAVGLVLSAVWPERPSPTPAERTKEPSTQ
jgi:uncharacterized membrane protein YgaE (UPF0421/DUF939 family)